MVKVKNTGFVRRALGSSRLVLLCLMLTACSQTAMVPTVLPTRFIQPAPDATSSLIKDTNGIPSTTPAATWTPVPTPIPPATKYVKVNGYKMAYACAGEGSPVVVIESGGQGQGISNAGWSWIVSEISRMTRVCVYDRANIGLSDPNPNIRSSADIARNLHEMLLAAHIPSPYVLVAHSIGGFTVRLFYSNYPASVAGIILLDSSHPGQWIDLAKAMPPEIPDESAELHSLRVALENQKHSRSKFFSVSSRQVEAAGDLGDIPLIVISRDPHTFSSLSLGEAWLGLQKQLAKLSTNSRLIVATGADHGVQYNSPVLVTNCILGMITVIRDR